MISAVRYWDIAEGVRRVQKDEMEEVWHLVLPPLLSYLDDFTVKNKILGLSLLDTLLDRVEGGLLRRTGVGKVFEQVRTQILFCYTLTALILVVNSVTHRDLLESLGSTLASPPFYRPSRRSQTPLSSPPASFTIKANHERSSKPFPSPLRSNLSIIRSEHYQNLGVQIWIHHFRAPHARRTPQWIDQGDDGGIFNHSLFLPPDSSSHITHLSSSRRASMDTRNYRITDQSGRMLEDDWGGRE